MKAKKWVLKEGQVPACLVSFKDGKVVRGRKFIPYTVWSRYSSTSPEKRRLIQELEIFMLKHPGLHAPTKEIALKLGLGGKSIEDMVRQIRKRHNLKAKMRGSTLPINAQYAIEDYFNRNKSKGKVQILAAIYEVYKRNAGLVVSYDAALDYLRLLAKKGRKVEVRGRGITRQNDLGIIRQKIHELERLERDGKLDWEKPIKFNLI